MKSYIIILFFIITLMRSCSGNLFNDALNSTEENNQEIINPTTNTASWIEVDMGIASTLNMGVIAVGKARDDDTTRVYAGEADFGDGDIMEYTYSGSSWSKASVVSALPNVSKVYALAIADLGNGSNIYTAGYNFAEYIFSGSAWTGGTKNIPVTNGIQWINRFDIGYRNNESTARVYIADWDRIVEISYNYGDWNGMEIDTDSQWVCDIVSARAGSDGNYRLYAILGTFHGPVWEFEWNGGSWVYTTHVSTVNDFEIISAGTGRNDGITRLYAWGNSGLYEISYYNGEWTSAEISNVAFNVDESGDILLADGRNDGFTRLYTADDNGVGEYTFSGSWIKTGLITTNPAGGIAAGNGRNDSSPVNRIYVTSGTNLYEYSAQTE